MKKLISSVLSVVLLLSTTAFAKDYSDYPQKFYDVDKSHWAYAYISELTDKNVISGYTDGSFKPENTVSRAEWSKMMVTSAGLNIKSDNYAISDLSKDHWAYNYVITAKDYMNWYSNNNTLSFKPNQAASREDVTVSLVKLKGYSVDDVDYSVLSAFKDVDSISNDLKKYVAVALQKNLISGFEDNTFRGQDTLTRAEASILLCRAFQMGNDNKVVDFNEANNSLGTGVSDTSYLDMFKETPTPIPTVEPTPQPTPEPAPIVNEGGLKDSYKVDTLVEVGTDIKDAVQNGNDLYYIDNSNNVYKVNMQTKESSVLMDSKTFSVNSGGETWCPDRIDNIFYDKKNNSVGVKGKFKKSDLFGNGEEMLGIPILVPSGKVLLKGTIAEQPNNIDKTTILSVLSNGTNIIVRSYDSGYECDIYALPSYDSFEYGYYKGGGFGNAIGLKNAVPYDANGNLYFAHYGTLYRYNFNSFDKVFEQSKVTANGLANNAFYIYGQNQIFKLDLDGNVQYQFSTDNIRVDDFKSLNLGNAFPKQFIATNDDIVFFDNNSKSFRIISGA